MVPPDWPITSGAIGAGWDANQAINGSGHLVIQVRPTGGWTANTNYGVLTFPDPGPGDYVNVAVYDADGYSYIHGSWPLFSTGLPPSNVRAEATTLSPLAVGMGSIAFASAAADTVSIANFVAATRGMIHFNFGATTVNAVERPPIDGHLPNSITGYRDWFAFRIWLDPDVQDLTFGVRCYFSTATHAGNVRLTIGSTTATINRTQAQNGTEGTATVTAAAVASTGWVDCAVTYERTVGTSGDAYVRNIRLQDAVILAADLPPPEND
jgi:hypothetical protein